MEGSGGCSPSVEGRSLARSVNPSGCSPCLPFQNGQKGQSSPCGKSSPCSCGQPRFPWLSASCLTPCWRKKSCNSCRTFGFVVTSVVTQGTFSGDEFS